MFQTSRLQSFEKLFQNSWLAWNIHSSAPQQLSMEIRAPIAVKTKIGWVVYGVGKSNLCSGRILHCHKVTLSSRTRSERDVQSKTVAHRWFIGRMLASTRISPQLKSQLWVRWVREYLPKLTRRTKLYTEVPMVKTGDVVYWSAIQQFSAQMAGYESQKFRRRTDYLGAR